MNSLVLLFFVPALATAKTSGTILGSSLLTDSAPAAVVSHTARLDIQPEPVVNIAPAVAPTARAIIAEPTIVDAPTVLSHQSRIEVKSEPAIVGTAAIAPITQTVVAEPTVAVGPAAIVAPAAISHQSRIDIKSVPKVIETIATAPIAYSAPIVNGAPLTTAAVAPTLVKTGIIAPTLFKTGAIAPGIVKTASITTPGVIATPTDIAASAVPLDTPEVVAARAAHF